MEQRSTPRFAVSSPAKVTVLGLCLKEPVSATLVNVSARGMRLLVPEPIGLDSAVRVDLQIDDEDALILGEVIYCVPAGNQFAIGLELQHSLLHLNQLAQWMNRVVPVPETQP